MRITLPSGTPAELARPSSGVPIGGLVLFPDIGGLRPLFDDLCQRLADDLDRVVCAPEPWPGRQAMALQDRLGAVGTLSDDDVLADAAAAAEATDQDPVSVLGFCMGGMYTLKAAAAGRYERAVPFYGMIRIPDQWCSATQREPLDLLAEGAPCPILGIFGTADPWTPAADIDALEGTGATVVRYQGADHGFVHDPDRPAHRPDDAADAWRRVQEFIAPA